MRPLVFSFTLLGVFAVFAVTGARLARAQGADPARAEAAERFDRGIRLVDEGDLSGGLAEFQRAYALVPAPVVLYNVGLVYSAMNRPVEAAHALEQALKSAASLKPENVQRAGDVLRAEKDKIGQVNVTANVSEGAVEIDNVEVAKFPLPGPLDVAGGPHVVGVITHGYAPARREVVVAAKQGVEVHLDLVPIEGLLGHIQVVCPVPAADVFVDGQRVGKTPLEASVTVAPASHTVEARREGYNPASKSITLGDGATAQVELDPTIDKSSLAREGGSLLIRASETQSVVTVDGAEVGLLTGPIELPAGPHRIHVERGGFLPAERDVTVPLGGLSAADVVFEPTPDTRAQYVAATTSRRTWSWITMGIGAALGGGGLALALVEQHSLTTDQATLNQQVAENTRHSGTVCDPASDLSGMPGGPGTPTQEQICDSALNSAQSSVNNDNTLRTIGWVGVGVGGAAIVTGIVLWITGDDPHRYDQRPADKVLGQWQIDPAVGLGTISLSASRSF